MADRTKKTMGLYEAVVPSYLQTSQDMGFTSVLSCVSSSVTF